MITNTADDEDNHVTQPEGSRREDRSTVEHTTAFDEQKIIVLEQDADDNITPEEEPFNDEAEEAVQPEVVFDKYIYSDIIFFPRKTFKRLLEVGDSTWVKRRILLLLFLLSFPQALTSSRFADRFVEMNLYYAVTGFLKYVLLEVAKNTLSGACIFPVLLLLCLMVGRKVLDRDVKFRDYAIILAWSLIPAIFANFGILGIQMIVNKIVTAQYVITQNTESTLTTMQIISVTLLFIKIALWIWSGYLFVYGLYVLHLSNIIHAFFNVFIPLLVLLAIYVVLGLWVEFPSGLLFQLDVNPYR